MTANADQNSGCLTFFLNLFGKRKQKAATDSEPLPYRLRDDFLSPAEFSFYRILSSIVGTRVTICAKVGLDDIFFVARPNENIAYRNRIDRKHVDFLLCDPANMKPICAVELDDASHRRADRKERDEFVDKVFQATGLPLLHIVAQREYSPREIGAQIAPFLKGQLNASTAPAATDTSQPTKALISDSAATAPLCPKCGVPMVVRTVASGEHQGKQFYGCPNYPKCHEMLPLTQRKPVG